MNHQEALSLKQYLKDKAEMFEKRDKFFESINQELNPRIDGTDLVCDIDFEPRPSHAYIYGKRINGVEENTISKERLKEIKRDLNKYFEGDLFE